VSEGSADDMSPALSFAFPGVITSLQSADSACLYAVSRNCPEGKVGIRVRQRFSTSPEQMAVIAKFIGIASVWSVLFGSLKYDNPAGPSIVAASLVFFLLSIVPVPRSK
jgi:hypothetical protein